MLIIKKRKQKEISWLVLSPLSHLPGADMHLGYYTFGYRCVGVELNTEKIGVWSLFPDADFGSGYFGFAYSVYLQPRRLLPTLVRNARLSLSTLRLLFRRLRGRA